MKKPKILETKKQIYSLLLKHKSAFNVKSIKRHLSGSYHLIEFFIQEEKFELYIQYYVRRPHLVDWILIGKEHFYEQITTKEVKKLLVVMQEELGR